MKSDPSQREPTFGFLSVLEHPTAGALGGLLLVNRRGRPVEFHCTAPVVTSRAEEILYGATLRPHLYCDRIGGVLLKKATVQPAIVLINQLDCWPLAEWTPAPVVLVDPSSVDPICMDPRSNASDPPLVSQQPALETACLDQVDLAQRPAVTEQLQQLTTQVDLAEPFERIAEAIREAGLLGETTASQPTEEAPRDQAA